MNTHAFGSFVAAQTQGAQILKGLFHSTAPVDTMDALQLAELKAVAEWMYGTTRYTRLQRRAVAAAEKNKLSVSFLVRIHKLACRLKNEKSRWKVWDTLTATALSAKALLDRGRALVAKLTPSKGPRQESLRITKGKDGMETIHLVTASSHATDLRHTVEPRAQELMKEDPTLRVDAAMGQAFREHLETGGVATTTYKGLVALTIDQHAAIMAGDGDDIHLVCSDGAIITGAEYVARATEEEVALVSPTKGCVNTYRTTRFANAKQREMLFVESPVCTFPGCSVPADKCQPHHVTSWKNGGNTNMDNLVLLCPFHNGRNDDDIFPVRHGHMEKIAGQAYLVFGAKRHQKKHNDHWRAKLGAWCQLRASATS